MSDPKAIEFRVNGARGRYYALKMCGNRSTPRPRGTIYELTTTGGVGSERLYNRRIGRELYRTASGLAVKGRTYLATQNSISQRARRAGRIGSYVIIPRQGFGFRYDACSRSFRRRLRADISRTTVQYNRVVSHYNQAIRVARSKRMGADVKRLEKERDVFKVKYFNNDRDDLRNVSSYTRTRYKKLFTRRIAGLQRDIRLLASGRSRPITDAALAQRRQWLRAYITYLKNLQSLPLPPSIMSATVKARLDVRIKQYDAIIASDQKLKAWAPDQASFISKLRGKFNRVARAFNLTVLWRKLLARSGTSPKAIVLYQKGQILSRFIKLLEPFDKLASKLFGNYRFSQEIAKAKKMLKNYSAYLLNTRKQDIVKRFGKKAVYKTIVQLYLKAYKQLVAELPRNIRLKQRYLVRKRIYEAMVRRGSYPTNFLAQMKRRFQALLRIRSRSIPYTLPIPAKRRSSHDSAIRALKAKGFIFKAHRACGYKRYVLTVPVAQLFNVGGSTVSSNGRGIIRLLANVFEAQSRAKVRIIGEADITGGVGDIRTNATSRAAMSKIKAKGLAVRQTLKGVLSQVRYNATDVILNAYENRASGDQSRIVFVLQYSSYTPSVFCKGLRVHGNP